ncbi:hypothetical protein EBZ38_13095, partial [bacterium]|nr:hypothetical protein [bacterium]
MLHKILTRFTAGDTNARASAAAPVQSVAGKTGAVTLAKADVGLSNVDNTSDLEKPISNDAAAAINSKVSLEGDTMTGALIIQTEENKTTTFDGSSIQSIQSGQITSWIEPSRLFVGRHPSLAPEPTGSFEW